MTRKLTEGVSGLWKIDQRKAVVGEVEAAQDLGHIQEADPGLVDVAAAGAGLAVLAVVAAVARAGAAVRAVADLAVEAKAKEEKNHALPRGVKAEVNQSLVHDHL